MSSPFKFKKFLNLLPLSLLIAAFFPVEAQHLRPGKIRKMIKRSAILNDHFTGFLLYDLEKRKQVTEQLSHHYFTPASNTKLYTFYAGLKLIQDSIPGLQYISRGDSLIFWATGDPAFLHPDFAEQRVLNFLRGSDKSLFWAKGLYKGDFYGTGWSYDDYNEYYQPEISELPVYGNIVRAQAKDGLMISSPALTSGGVFNLVTDSINSSKYAIHREFDKNVFHQPSLKLPSTYKQEIPFKTNDWVIDTLLKAALPNYRGIISMDKPAETRTIYSVPRDTLFKHMLLPSDNFIAEQLLLSCAALNNLPMNTDSVIQYMITDHLSDLPDKPQWVDGSGLSRQDLFTPADMVKICEKIYDEVKNEERLFGLLPQGGKTGTLKNYFKADKPFLFAKTGSLSNNHNLTGYLKTKSGKTLIFSFMNNNYIRSTAEIRKEMERILTMIHEKY
jgi:D-alanyl-D-alanine carboxypeptidase/D-alanyl-D-alanine-endopeptidase (penicillin-binding protein 4)